MLYWRVKTQAVDVCQEKKKVVKTLYMPPHTISTFCSLFLAFTLNMKHKYCCSLKCFEDSTRDSLRINYCEAKV